ncbi:hypothetical protein DSCOOX_52470 [Desulfosarcina ovata subsp. ovata]|uniref:Uncharacterized protein n=1 Tax=Desulfosarcina ovata subsp. ovata TaxID=2752305 RepID=A0A5K8AHD4_9BACT|nr:hypothetical protein DSCOOX_52470 [Desulfosarcina ovata subsp. ovata]
MAVVLNSFDKCHSSVDITDAEVADFWRDVYPRGGILSKRRNNNFSSGTGTFGDGVDHFHMLAGVVGILFNF